MTSFSIACGAVYKPDWLIVPLPCVTAHVTAVFDMPETAAVNCTCCVECKETVPGETLTATVCGTLTMTIAEADFVVSALLTAVIV
jgi:hypothetical protein